MRVSNYHKGFVIQAEVNWIKNDNNTFFVQVYMTGLSAFMAPVVVVSYLTTDLEPTFLGSIVLVHFALNKRKFSKVLL